MMKRQHTQTGQCVKQHAGAFHKRQMVLLVVDISDAYNERNLLSAA